MITCRCLAPVMALAVLSVSMLLAQQPAPTRSSDLIKAAGQFVELLDKGEFARATQSFDAAMLKALPPAELKKTWETVIHDAGAFKKQVASRLETVKKYEVIFVTCEFAKTRLDARVVFDKDAKITGLFFAPVQKPAPEGVEEIWEGPLKVAAVELRLVFHFFKQKDGSYAGTMESPDQGAGGLILDEVKIKDDTVRLSLDRLKVAFEGKRSKDGQEIAGDFKQFGKSYPLTLKKVARAREARRPQTPRKPYPYDEIEVSYENKKGGVKLAGALTLPRSKGPFPAVLLITGSGAQDRDETILGHKPFLVLADYLTRRGIAVLRLDDRGVGGSSGSVPNSTSADFADDVLAGVEFLKGRKEIDAARIGLIGHSEGGMIAPLVASRSRDIAFIVLLAGTGLPGDQILRLQSAAILKSAGADAEQLARHKAVLERLIGVIRQEKDNDAAENKIRDALDELTSKLSKDEKKQLAEAMPLFEGQIKELMTPWFRYFLDYDPRPALRKVSCPVLALGGEKDLQVDSRLNLEAIAAALKEGGNKDFTIRQLPNLNHLFQTCKTGAVLEYNAIEETLAPVLLETVAEWILQRTKGAVDGGRDSARPQKKKEVFSPYATQVLKLAPAGYWRLGEPQGPTAFDWSGHKHNGTYHGSPMFHETGAIHSDPDRAVRLAGKSYIEIPAAAAFSLGSKGLTVEAWLRPDVLDFPGQGGKGGDPYVHWLGKGESKQFEWGFRFYSRKLPDGSMSSRPNRISAYIWNAAGGEGAGAYFEEPLTAGKWIHVVAVYEPANKPKAGVLIYRDGVFKKGPPDKGTLYASYKITPTSGTAPLRLGTRDKGRYLVGGLDEVAIYPRMLSAAEIRQNYLLGAKGSLPK